jgi:hypothetical protein
LRWLSLHAYLPSGELAPTELAERCNAAALDKMQPSPLLAYFRLECGRPKLDPENSPSTWPPIRRSEEDGFLSFSPALVDFDAGAAGRLQWFASGEMHRLVEGDRYESHVCVLGTLDYRLEPPPRCAPDRVQLEDLTQFTLGTGGGTLRFVRAPQKAKRSRKNTGALLEDINSQPGLLQAVLIEHGRQRTMTIAHVEGGTVRSVADQADGTAHAFTIESLTQAPVHYRNDVSIRSFDIDPLVPMFVVQIEGAWRFDEHPRSANAAQAQRRGVWR